MNEGLHLARQAGLWLYQVELLCVRTELLLAGGQSAAMLLGGSPASTAERSAREAYQLASASDCQFVWGEAEAGHLLGRAMQAQGRLEEALSVLEPVRSIRLRIGDDRVEQTETLIRSIARHNEPRA